MKSPTSSILHSIQTLKSKLKNDHLQLQGIRRDFAMYPIKPIIQQQSLQSLSTSEYYKPTTSVQKNSATKISQLKKNHNSELQKLREQHLQQKSTLSDKYQNKIHEIITLYDNKIKQQDDYIHLLQHSLSNPSTSQPPLNPQLLPTPSTLTICPQVYQLTPTQLTFDDNIYYKLFSNKNYQKFNNQTIDTQLKVNYKQEVKYDLKFEKITNKLLQQNTYLLQNLQRLKMQNRRLKFQQNQYYHKQSNYTNHTIKQPHPNPPNYPPKQYSSLKPPIPQNPHPQPYKATISINKNRLKFSKGLQDKNKIFSDRSYSSINSQNINTSNIMYKDLSCQDKDIFGKQQHSIQKSIVQEEQQQSILEQDFKLKTIKHFMKVISHRSSQFQSPQSFFLPKQKKYQINKHQYKNISVL